MKLWDSIYCGDNLDVARTKLQDLAGDINLIYIDPPFYSNRTYEVVWGDGSEVQLFEDRWKGGINQYIKWMMDRITVMRDLLAKDGSMYVHLDHHAAHYIKVAMDDLFGRSNFQNEIIWHFQTGGGGKKRWRRKHHNILFYSKSRQWHFDPVGDREPYAESTRKRYRKSSQVRDSGTYDYDVSEGKIPSDVWAGKRFQPPIGRLSAERAGYRTQKPLELLKRILNASSNPDDLVADFFCGCGTTLVAAAQMNRRWIGCDVSPLACKFVAQRLNRDVGLREVRIDDYPDTIEGLRKLDPFEFQNFIVYSMNGRLRKMSRDMGIDGYTYFENLPIQVKQRDKVGRPDIDMFATAVRRDKKEAAIFVAFSFTGDAYEEAARQALEEDIHIDLKTVEELGREFEFLR